MKKTTLLSLILTVSAFYLGAQNAIQDFDNNGKSNWDYTTNIPFYSMNNGTEIWEKRGENVRIPNAYSGTTFQQAGIWITHTPKALQEKHLLNIFYTLTPLTLVDLKLRYLELITLALIRTIIFIIKLHITMGQDGPHMILLKMFLKLIKMEILILKVGKSLNTRYHQDIIL